MENDRCTCIEKRPKIPTKTYCAECKHDESNDIEPRPQIQPLEGLIMRLECKRSEYCSLTALLVSPRRRSIKYIS